MLPRGISSAVTEEMKRDKKTKNEIQTTEKNSFHNSSLLEGLYEKAMVRSLVFWWRYVIICA
jgi:hypothetical protein